MKKILWLLMAFAVFSGTLNAQTILPKDAPKIQPEELIALWESADVPENLYIFNTGPVNDIRDAVNIGAVENAKNLKKFKKQLRKLPKDATIIYYCGCCPFATCPNLLPAYNLLGEMNFTNYRALDLPKSVKLDWMEKGYPMKD